MSQKLSYPKFSVVFIQTFSVHHTKEFILPEKAIDQMYEKYNPEDPKRQIYYEKADALKTPIAWEEKSNIEDLIFTLPPNSPYEAPPTIRKRLFRKPRRIPMKGNFQRYSLRGFDFTMNITRQRDERIPALTLSGHCNVEMNLFFEHTVSITYRFLFDGHSCKLSNKKSKHPSAITDHLIVFLSTWLNAERWNDDNIEYPTRIKVDKIWFDSNGDPLEAPESFYANDPGNSFDAIAIRYKNYIYAHCTQFKEEISRKKQRHLERDWAKPCIDEFLLRKGTAAWESLPLKERDAKLEGWAKGRKDIYIKKHGTEQWEGLKAEEKRELLEKWAKLYIQEDKRKIAAEVSKNLKRRERKSLEKEWNRHPFGLERDSRYAMVDIWEDLQNKSSWGVDIFKGKEEGGWMSEAQIIEHIRREHKDELIGLLSLYPEEWPYRDPEAYDEVCGENIAIDTDDLVLAGSNLCVVIGTYGRRGKDVEGNNWEQHLEGRGHYHVSWPEYLLIVQMILAKKYVIGLATDELIDSTRSIGKREVDEALIKQNADLSIRLTRLITQLDVLKYARYPSHKVMYNRTSKRLGLEEDYERLNTLIENVDSSLHNITDYKAMKSDFYLNIILAVVSVVSTFELLYQDSQLHFINKLFSKEDTSCAASWIIAVVAAITIVAVVFIVGYTLKAIASHIRSKRYE